VIEIRLANVLEEKGATLYWLAKGTGLRYATVWNLARGDLMKLDTNVLDRICEALECQPGDLLVRVVSRKSRKRGK
jgi:putative transcriptional regulator